VRRRRLARWVIELLSVCVLIWVVLLGPIRDLFTPTIIPLAPVDSQWGGCGAAVAVSMVRSGGGGGWGGRVGGVVGGYGGGGVVGCRGGLLGVGVIRCSLGHARFRP